MLASLSADLRISLFRSGVRVLVGLCTPARIRRYTGSMLVLILAGGLFNLLGGDGLLDRSGHVIGADYVAFHTGAGLYQQGHRGDLYDFDLQWEFQKRLVAPGQMKKMHPFINPPHALVLYIPFAIWSYPVALAAWWLAGVGLLAASAWLLRRELPGLATLSLPRLVGASFLFFPTLAWLFYGQASAWILLLYTGTFVSLRRGRDFSAGLCLGSLAFKPQLAFALALVMIFNRRWRVVLGGILATASWLGVGLLLSPEATIRYLALSPHLFDLLRNSIWEFPTWGVHSIYGFTLLLLDGVSTGLAKGSALLLGFGTLALLASAWRGAPWQPGSRSWDLRMAGSFALGLIISPHLFVYDLTLLLLPFAVVWHHHRHIPGAPALDGGPLLACSASLWMLSFLGSYLSKFQILGTQFLGLPPVALQLSTLVIFAWGLLVLRASAHQA